MTHPIRNAELHTFERGTDTGKGAIWIAMFHPYPTYPVFFQGKTEAAAIEAAEAMRTEAIEKHEAACILRQEQSRKAKERAAAKKAAKEAA